MLEKWIVEHITEIIAGLYVFTGSIGALIYNMLKYYINTKNDTLKTSVDTCSTGLKKDIDASILTAKTEVKLTEDKIYDKIRKIEFVVNDKINRLEWEQGRSNKDFEELSEEVKFMKAEIISMDKKIDIQAEVMSSISKEQTAIKSSIDLNNKIMGEMLLEIRNQK